MIIFMILTLFLGLVIGIPVAIMLSTTGLLFAFLGSMLGIFDSSLLQAIPNRLFGILENPLLVCIPLFILMGNILQRTQIAEQLLQISAQLLANLRGGLAVAVMLVGVVLAATTGIVGATVITMGLIALPTLIKHHYPDKLATGTIATAGTLGQLVPPSIALILLSDVLASSYQQAQLKQGKFFLETVSVAELFSAALIPSAVLVFLYCGYIVWASPRIDPSKRAPLSLTMFKTLLLALVPAIALVGSVLGTILLGLATPTEAAAVGALGAGILAIFYRRLDYATMQIIVEQTLFITCMVFFILIGASIFSLTFRGLGGDEQIEHVLLTLPGGLQTQLALVMVILFLLGFILDFIEIIFIVVPIIAPILIAEGANPVWLGLLITINLQTSFLTPPFGFALFYLRGVTPASIETKAIYKGVIPFIVLQLLMLGILMLWPPLATWLPEFLLK